VNVASPHLGLVSHTGQDSALVGLRDILPHPVFDLLEHQGQRRSVVERSSKGSSQHSSVARERVCTQAARKKENI
jgi:hypothetical protein